MAGMDDLCIAMDVGGTRTRVALVDRAGNVVLREGGGTQALAGSDEALERIATFIDSLLTRTGERRVVGIGASLAGPVDPVTGTLYAPPNLPGWDGFSPGASLEPRFGLPVWAANDATLGAVGEHAYGAGRGLDNMVYLTVSTGIGGGVIADGEPLTGARGYAAELGHMVIDRNGPPCSCGSRGCLESLASGTSTARFAREGLARGEGRLLAEIAGGDPSKVTSALVMDAAVRGDPLAAGIMHRFVEDLGLGLANLMHIFDPDLIVLGGGVSRSFDDYADALLAATRRQTMANLRDKVNVTATALGDDAPLLGAARLAFQRAERGA
ncbi:MAG: ROK family protein [Chloroflexota bacterium]|nr:ROK family protein [Chloroflexota bacterium]MDE2941091.1 ROK family protein [Chloroflexota bacterium]MDE3267383.1 ROK family protein [Chloroflexota bacterium]